MSRTMATTKFDRSPCLVCRIFFFLNHARSLLPARFCGWCSRFGMGRCCHNDRRFDLTRLCTKSHATNRLLVIAGATSSGSTDGIGTAARFHGPSGMCFYAGTPKMLYVGDESNHKVRSINLDTSLFHRS